MNAEVTANLSEDERGNILRHLGYPVVNPVSAIALGFPAATQPMFLVLNAMNFIPQSRMAMVRLYLNYCDGSERKIFESQERLQAKKVGEIDLNPEEPDLLKKEYNYWCMRLADVLGVPLRIYSQRFQGGINIPVVH